MRKQNKINGKHLLRAECEIVMRMNPVQTYGRTTVNLLSITHYVYNIGCISAYCNYGQQIYIAEDLERFQTDYSKIHYQQANNLKDVVDKLIETIQFVPGGNECAAAETRFNLNLLEKDLSK